jgi:hypothetical protein
MVSRAEFKECVRLSQLLDLWLPDSCFWSAIDVTPRSATNGFVRRLKGCKAGVPDYWIIYRSKLITIEMKSPRGGGQCRPAQRAVREQLLKAGIKAWWQCCTAEGAMWALAKSGLKFRTLTNPDGSIETWKQPPLERFEVPKRDPRERRPRPPSYWSPKPPVETATGDVVATDATAPADIAA